MVCMLDDMGGGDRGRYTTMPSITVYQMSCNSSSSLLYYPVTLVRPSLLDFW